MRVRINGQDVDVKERSPIAVTYQVNDIAELKSSQANYSNNIKLPKTVKNIGILGNLSDISIVNRLPYQRINASIESGGVELMPDGLAKINGANKDEYEINIYSGNINFFEAIKNKKLSDLDLSDLNHIWDMITAHNSRANAAGYVWAIGDFGAMRSDENINHVDKSIPSVFVKTLFDRIFAEAGYVASGDVINSDFFSKLVVPCVNFTALKKLRIENTVTSTYATLHPLFPANSLVFYLLNQNPVTDPNNEYTVTEFKVVIRDDVTGNEATYQMQEESVKFTNVGAYTDILLIEEITDDIGLTLNNLTGEISGLVPGRSYTYTTTITIENTDEASHQFCVAAVDFSAAYIENLTGIQTLYYFAVGQMIDVAASLPDMKQDEFIRAIMQMCGLIIQSDKYTNDVYFRQFQTISETNAVDWSDKMTDDNHKVSFRYGTYGKRNYLLYSNDENISKYYGSYFFDIDDFQLPAYSELFDIPFSASLQYKRMLYGILMAYINILDDDEAITKQPKPRICLIKRQDRSMLWDDGVTASGMTGLNTAFLYFSDRSEDYSLDFDWLISNFYGKLISMLTDIKVVECEMLLTDSDIAALDHFKPVYLRKYGEYFYINKISNFISGKPSKVMLIRL